jgi:hypothetical protein
MNKINQSNFLIADIWNNYYIDINNRLLNYNILKSNLTIFWKEIIEKIGDKYVILLLRIEYIEGDIATLGNLHKINNKDFDLLLSIFKDILHFKNEGYKIREIKNIIFSYKIIPDDKLKNKSSKLISRNKNDNKTTYKFSGWKLPNTMDYNLFGQILTNIKNKTILIKDINEQYYYNVFIKKDHNEVHLLNSTKNLIVTFLDYPADKNNLNSFTRIINNQTYYFKDNQLIFKTLKRSTNFLTSIEKDNKLNNKFMVMDIETQTINNVMTPYIICIFDGVKKLSFYLTDYKNYNDMIIHAINSIMKRKYNGYKVYIHNLSNFDGIFILKALSSIKYSSLKPIIKDDKMIDIKIIFGKYNIAFRDSLLMLPSSLRKLAI